MADTAAVPNGNGTKEKNVVEQAMPVVYSVVSNKVEARAQKTTSAPDYDDATKGGLDRRESSVKEEDKFTFMQACALNTLNMFGTGPFITIPFLLAATTPSGPHALIGYALAAFVCVNDSFVWAELGAMFPYSGGSYTYLREVYGRDTYGRLMAWLFIWQFFLSGPLEVASGFVAMSQYLAYVTGIEDGFQHSLIAFFFCMVSIAALYNDVGNMSKITVALWVGTVAAILFTIVAGFSNFNASNFDVPANWMDNKTQFFLSLGIAARIGIYDFTGYFDVCHIGSEVQNPKRNIPRSCVITCCVVCVIYFLVYGAVIGFLPWDGPNGFVALVDGESDKANYIMSLFAEKLWGRNFAIFFTLVVLYTIFGSCFALLLGYAQIPYASAKDGYFLEYFAHEHSSRAGLPDRALIVLGALSCVCCFLDLEVLIEGMLTTRLIMQFIAQAVGVMMYRNSHPDADRPYKVPLYPIPNLICIAGFFFVFVTTDNYFVSGNLPLLEVGVLFIVAGSVTYMVWAAQKGFFPFERDLSCDGVECCSSSATHHCTGCPSHGVKVKVTNQL